MGNPAGNTRKTIKNLEIDRNSGTLPPTKGFLYQRPDRITGAPVLYTSVPGLPRSLAYRAPQEHLKWGFNKGFDIVLIGF